MRALYGPRWRMLVIGAGQLSRALAQMALGLDFEVIVCDPREEYHLTWDVPGTTFSTAMPDDLAVELQLDPHTAVVAVTHDPKLDDLVLLEALKSPAFYVGALGSRGNTAKRKERLALFDLSAAEIARLHGPIGLDIGSRTPAEIAVSILAEIVAVKNGVALKQKKPVAATRDPAALDAAGVIPLAAAGRPTRCPTPSCALGRERAKSPGLVAAGGELTPRRLAEAYRQGHLPLVQRRPAGALVVARPAHGAAAGRVQAQPVAEEDDPPLRRHAGLRDAHRQRVPRASSRACATAPRDGQAGTWIVPEMIDAYVRAGTTLGRVAQLRDLDRRRARRRPLRRRARPDVLRRIDVRPPHRRLEDRARGAGRVLPRPTASRRSTASSAPPTSPRSAAARSRAPSSSSRLGTALATPPRRGLVL